MPPSSAHAHTVCDPISKSVSFLWIVGAFEFFIWLDTRVNIINVFVLPSLPAEHEQEKEIMYIWQQKVLPLQDKFCIQNCTKLEVNIGLQDIERSVRLFFYDLAPKLISYFSTHKMCSV